jgi:hypothetical protein
MKLCFRIAVAIAGVLSLSGFAETATKELTGFPFKEESLQFSVNWPSGISLGQARMQARRIEQDRWEFEFTLDASIPGFVITDRYRSIATADLCSVEFQRDSTHGSKKTREFITFAQDRNMAHRTTGAGGGSSDFRVPDCAKDALTFLYFTRVEMGQGRVPLATTVSFGGPYEIQLEYKGEELLKGNIVTDRLASSARGSGSNSTFDLLFARDPARTPLVVRTPMPLGTFSLELTR